MRICEEEVIVEKLEKITTTTNTIWSPAIESFLKNTNNKKEDYLELIDQLKQQIATGSQTMKNILGDTYTFFKEY
jgi:hypothetical protein